MSAEKLTGTQITLHLTQQSTVTFHASELWPMEGEYARFGNDIAACASEVGRRLRTDGFLGFTTGAQDIALIPLEAIKRIDLHTD